MPDIDVAFQTQYEADVLHALQQSEASLLKTFRYKPVSNAKEAQFNLYGRMEMSERTQHRSELAITNAETSVVKVAMKDYATRTLIDRFDQLKTELDEYQAAVKAGAMAAERKLDEIMFGALNGEPVDIVHSSTPWDVDKVLEVRKTISERFIPFDMELVTVVGPDAWNSLMLIEQFSNADYVGHGAELPWPSGFQAKRWMGQTWLEHPAIPTVAGVAKNYTYHKSGVGIGVADFVRIDAGWLRSHQSWEVIYTLSAGALVIDPERVIITETQH